MSGIVKEMIVDMPPKLREAFNLVKFDPLSIQHLKKIQRLYDEAEGEEARQIGNLWEPIYWKLSVDVLLEWEAYRQDQDIPQHTFLDVDNMGKQE